MRRKTAATVDGNPARGVHRRLFILSLPVAAGLALVGILNCGRKAPPVPPRRPALPVVTELSARLQDDTAILTWRHPSDARGIDGYIVFRAQTSAADPPCAGCPLVFQKAGEVRQDPGLAAFEFRETLRPGFVYTYKVQPIGSSGDRGPESNRVIIDRSE